MRRNLSSSILQRVVLNTPVQHAGLDLPFLQVVPAHGSQNTPCHCFTAESRQMPGAQGCQCLVAVLAAMWGFHCCLCCHRDHPKPGAKHATASPWVHPKQGAEAVHGNQKGKETVVKHATLKIPLKLMRIWLLAMSRAAAGPRHGLDLKLNSYIFFPPSFS